MSQIKKNSRWLENDWIDSQTFFTPLIIRVLQNIIITQKESMLIIDGSIVGRGCQTLMVSVLWKGKALPIAWKTIQVPKTRRPQVFSTRRPFSLVKLPIEHP